jgi:hypothetical protein
LDKENDDASTPLARLSQPPESLIFERNVQSGVNETSKKESIGYRVKGIEKNRWPTVGSPQPTAKNEKPTMNLYCWL